MPHLDGELCIVMVETPVALPHARTTVPRANVGNTHYVLPIICA
jgi:hypothetical protein